MSRRFWPISLLILIVTVGCAKQEADEADKKEICKDSVMAAEPTFPDTVTFAEHIAPIVHQNCMPCHRPNEAGPFNLITYNDVRKRAQMVQHVTEIGYMPPWPADKEYRHFLGERGLSDHQIKLIQMWVQSGAAMGDPTKIPEPPTYPSGSQLGKPDLVLSMKEAVFIRGDNLDRFLIVKLPFEIPEGKYVRVAEFVPGNRQLVHHVNGALVNFETAKKRDPFEGVTYVDPEEYRGKEGLIEAYKALGLTHDDGTFPPLTPSAVNYLPGVIPVVYPKGIGGYYMAKKGTFLFRDIHYGPSAKDTFDISHINIFFADGPPKRKVEETQMGTLGISPIIPPLKIPPDTVMTFRSELKVPIDISLLTINPHMHLLGRRFTSYAVTANGDTIPLVRIKDWDFRWQYFYTFPKMLRVPAGSTIVVEGVFDNTSDNPQNPFDPPRYTEEPEGNMKTTDEMLQLIINYLPYQPGDEHIELGGHEIR